MALPLTDMPCPIVELPSLIVPMYIAFKIYSALFSTLTYKKFVHIPKVDRI